MIFLRYANDLKVCQYGIYMSGVFTKHPPEKLEYWRKYRRENAMRCREQRSQWREANRERIRLCARRSYYRRLLRVASIYRIIYYKAVLTLSLFAQMAAILCNIVFSVLGDAPRARCVARNVGTCYINVGSSL